MGLSDRFRERPVYRQLKGEDRLGRGSAAKSRHTERLRPRTDTADHVTQSISPYCAVGCGQQVYVKDNKVVQIEGDPASPVSRGRLCPKGSATLQLTHRGPAVRTRSRQRSGGRRRVLPAARPARGLRAAPGPRRHHA
jgi:formate dehydrogenase major subunit